MRFGRYIAGFLAHVRLDRLLDGQMQEKQAMPDAVLVRQVRRKFPFLGCAFTPVVDLLLYVNHSC
jgi:hypothetical protein